MQRVSDSYYITGGSTVMDHEVNRWLTHVSLPDLMDFGKEKFAYLLWVGLVIYMLKAE